MPIAIHRPRLGEYVASAPQLGNDAHPLGNIEAGARADLLVLPEGTSLDDYIFTRPGPIEVMAGGRWQVRQGQHVAREAVSARFARVMARLRG